VLAKPTGIIIGPILSLYLFVKRRSVHTAFFPLLGTTGGVILYGFYNWIRFGHLLDFGAPRIFKLEFIPSGLLGLLVSPGMGLLWYSPVIILSIIAFFEVVKSKRILEAVTVVGIFLSYLMIYSIWNMWSGGWSWGPRFLLPSLPGLVALIALLDHKWKKIILILTLLGFVINAPTLVSFYERYYSEAYEKEIPFKKLLWSPSYSPIYRMWGAAYRQIKDASETDVRDLVREASLPENGPSPTIATSQAFRIVALWWWMLPIVGISRWVGVVCMFCLIGFGVCLLLKGYKSILV